jgi:hypothetical protein
VFEFIIYWQVGIVRSNCFALLGSYPVVNALYLLVTSAFPKRYGHLPQGSQARTLFSPLFGQWHIRSCYYLLEFTISISFFSFSWISYVVLLFPAVVHYDLFKEKAGVAYLVIMK